MHAIEAETSHHSVLIDYLRMTRIDDAPPWAQLRAHMWARGPIIGLAHPFRDDMFPGVTQAGRYRKNDTIQTSHALESQYPIQDIAGDQ